MSGLTDSVGPNGKNLEQDVRLVASGFWKALGEEAKKQKLFWGGGWASLRDRDHVQLLANSQLGEVRQKCGGL
jgi:hypothetical protein